MGDTLYIQTDKNVEVHRPHIYLQDIAQLACNNNKILNRCRVMPVANLDGGEPGRYVMSITDVIKQVQQKNENLDITHIGEPTFIITYEAEKHAHRILNLVKTVLVCLITFFGTGFSIMTFNNDVDVNKLFQQIYEQFTGQASSGFTVLEITYSLGIGIGVLFFFNHFGRRKITRDPTPMQVQMRLYEDDVDTTIVENVDRGGKQSCGSR